MPPHKDVKSMLWCFSAINPAKCKEHEMYIDTLCKDFEQQMKDLILKGIEEREQSGTADPLLMEILQHTKFCQDKCKAFYGRKCTIQVFSNTYIQ